MNQLETKHDIDDDTIERLAVQAGLDRTIEGDPKVQFRAFVRDFASACYAEGQRNAQPQPFRLPEPMTKAELLAIRMKARASPEAETTNWPALACRAVEAEVISRIEAALEAKALYLHPPTLRLPEPMTDDALNKVSSRLRDDLLDHIYEYTTMSEGILPMVLALCRAIEAETLRRVRECNDTPPLPVQQDDDKNPWHEAIDNELVCCHIVNEANCNDPRKALQDIINWHVQVALDPAVSSEAQKLIERGLQQDDEALEVLRRVANHLSEVGNHGDSFGWKDALKDARALIAKRGAE